MQLNHGKFLDNGRYETYDNHLLTHASQIIADYLQATFKANVYLGSNDIILSTFLFWDKLFGMYLYMDM